MSRVKILPTHRKMSAHRFVEMANFQGALDQMQITVMMATSQTKMAAALYVSLKLAGNAVEHHQLQKMSVLKYAEMVSIWANSLVMMVTQ